MISDKSQINLERNRKDFVKFVDEHDKRRGTDFLSAFPEFSDFYQKYKKE